MTRRAPAISATRKQTSAWRGRCWVTFPPWILRKACATRGSGTRPCTQKHRGFPPPSSSPSFAVQNRQQIHEAGNEKVGRKFRQPVTRQAVGDAAHPCACVPGGLHVGLGISHHH